MSHRLYTAIIYLIMPFIFLRMYWRGRRNPQYRKHWAQRLGHSPHRLDRCLWIHAVSVGEVGAAEPLIKQLQMKMPDRQILVTTTTPTGADHVAKLFGDSVLHTYFPFDYPFAIERFLRRVKPEMLLMMETEIWPNLLDTCHQQGIPTLLANARLSEKSAKGYARLGQFSRLVFSHIGHVAAQSEDDAARFQRFGISPERIQVTGSLKFEVRLPASVTEQAEVLRRSIGASRPVWVAASTRDGEESYVLDAHKLILTCLPEALLILIPRHPERFNKVAQLCDKRGFKLVRRTDHKDCDADVQIFLGDTMGEMPLFMAASDAAFVGGSLVKLGGQNILEPAAVGVPVAFGPHMFNFAEISRLFLQKGAAAQVEDARELGQLILRWLSDAGIRSEVGEKGRHLIEQNRGATQRLLTVVTEVLGTET